MASVARIPLLDEIESVKIGIFAASVAATAGMVAMVRGTPRLWSLLAVACLVVSLRLTYGAIAAAGVGQPLWPTLQEARFGLLLLALPPAFLLLRDAPRRTLQCFVAAYLLLLLLIDTLAFTLPVTRGLLLLGQRTDNRFVISVVAPWVAATILLLRHRDPDRRLIWWVSAAASLMLLHALMVSTSRSEALLAAGLLGFSLWLAGPYYRLLTGLMVTITAVIAAASLSDTAGIDTGRDFQTAYDLVERVGPLGLGLLRDDLARASLGLSSRFYISDYGLLVYVLRYGLAGIVMIYALFLIWLNFTFRAARTFGIVALSVPILIYLFYIPILDYGGLNAAFLLALLISGGVQQNRVAS